MHGFSLYIHHSEDKYYTYQGWRFVMRSVWTDISEEYNFEELKGDARTDVLIIGGGIAGILCAYKLKNAGVDCILAEAGRICGGITKNTTAKITLQHGLFCDKLIKKYGLKAAKLYVEAQAQAGMEFRDLCRKIDCDYETKDSYVYSLNSRAEIEKEVTALQRVGATAEFSDAPGLPFPIAGAVRVKDQAQFHPLKFLYKIAKDLPVFENTKVTEVMPRRAKTDKGEISFEKLIIATHFPILNKHGGYFLKMYQERSYVTALKGAENMDGMYVDASGTGLSFRNYKDLLLLGGGSHRTGKKGGAWRELEAFAHKYYPQADIAYEWATQDCMTLDGVPYIGQYSNSTPQVYVATGFNKWGMTNAMAASNILCDLITKNQSKYESVFSPSRSILHPQLAVNTLEAVLGWLNFTAPRCPHLGCALKYNKAEHTWDCPCHGSRFSENGELIDNPATDDKRMS